MSESSATGDGRCLLALDGRRRRMTRRVGTRWAVPYEMTRRTVPDFDAAEEDRKQVA